MLSLYKKKTEQTVHKKDKLEKNLNWRRYKK